MELKNFPEKHLTYCSNIHPGESWEEHFRHLKTWLPGLKKQLSPDRPFGLGLRLSARAARDLLTGNRLKECSAWLEEEDFYLFTINGFPYGNFHRTRVKEQVYLPDWSSDERLSYTLDLVKILSALLPGSVDGGISTSPLGYKYAGLLDHTAEQFYRECCSRLAKVAWEMHLVEQRTGKELHLDIEPEPDCILENSRETVAFFTERLFPLGSGLLSTETGLSAEEACRILRRHIRVCYDTCHFAVEFEEPEEAVRRILQAGIGIGKVQISAALRVKPETGQLKEVAATLKKFDEPVYLHQVVRKRKDGSIRQYRDLPDALAELDHPGMTDPDAPVPKREDPESDVGTGFVEPEDSGSSHPGAGAGVEEWRIHYHVPLYSNRFGELETTRDHITEGIATLLRNSGCRHFEVETYTWEVLPDEQKRDLPESLKRELLWALEQIDAVSEANINPS